MPEFILNTAGTSEPWESLDDFTKGFIEACFFTSESQYPAKQFFSKSIQAKLESGEIDGSIPKDSSPANIDRDSFCLIKDFCEQFQVKAATALTEAYQLDYDESQAGRDLYFTYAGHGVGYWSRDELSVSSDPEKTKELQEIMRAPGTTPDQWTKLLEQCKALESAVGHNLTKYCGRGEIYLEAYKVKGGFRISVYIG